jgi:hypothetical protein
MELGDPIREGEIVPAEAPVEVPVPVRESDPEPVEKPERVET